MAKMGPESGKKSLFIFTKQKIRNYITTNSSTSIIVIYNLITVVLIAAFYPIIPTLLNYPPNNEEVSTALGTSNILQYFILGVYSCSVGTVFLMKSLKKFKGWESLDKNNEADREKVHEIRKKSIDLPIFIFIFQITTFNVPLILIGVLVTTLNNTPKMVVLKVIMMTLSLFALAAVSTYIFSKRIFKTVLLKTYLGEKPEGRRISLKKNIFIQIVPMLAVAIILTTLIGYSRVINEKSDLIYSIYRNMLIERFSVADDITSTKQALDILQKIRFDEHLPRYFVKAPDGTITTSDGSVLGGYFLYYIANPYKGDRMYDLNAETQGIVIRVGSKAGEWRLGVIFEVASNKTISFFFIGFIALMLLNILVLYYFVNSLSDDISMVAESLMDIAEGENVSLNKQLPVTSNDEIGDLVIAFNKIQEKEKEHIREVEEQQALIVEQERLASLGQLVGGIAHNMRTPIMSLAGAIEGLKDLVDEYRTSIGDKSVTEEDHLEIARDMMEWLNKMEPFCAYMSDMLVAVKEQTVQQEDTEMLEFTVDELTKRVELLMNNELKRNSCVLKTDCRVDKNTKIMGDLSILVQILNNLITNAIQSYEDTGNDIEFMIKKNGSRIEFIIKDFGMGIPEQIKGKLFKEMVTTKGKQGTGLGLFISYSNIKARFKGNMWFESEEGEGTTFYVTIPLSSS